MEQLGHMGHENEYHDKMITMLELIWGEGYMAPGGAGNVARMLRNPEAPLTGIVNRLIASIN